MSLTVSVASRGQNSDPTQEGLESLKPELVATQNELRETEGHQHDEMQIATEDDQLDPGDNPTRGDHLAALTLLEFSDYQCPVCARHFRETYPQIDKEYIETGKLKYVFLDLPLVAIHDLAFKAAVAAHCAGEQGMYWEMHDRLLEFQQTLGAWTSHAEAVGLDVMAFEECLSGRNYDENIRKDMEEGSTRCFRSRTRGRSNRRRREKESVREPSSATNFPASLRAAAFDG